MIVSTFFETALILALTVIRNLPRVQALNYGIDVKPNELPWVVKITHNVPSKGASRSVMTGTYVAKGWVLVTYEPDSLPMTIDFGSYPTASHSVTILNYSNIFKYEPESLNYAALVKIPLSLIPEHSQNIRPISLPSKTLCDELLTDPKNAGCLKLTFAGWGPNEKVDSNTVLRKLPMQLLASSNCEGRYSYFNSKQFVCTTAKTGPGKTISGGDMGAPLMCQTNKENWEIIGMSVFEPKDGDFGSVLEKVPNLCEINDWAKKTIRENSDYLDCGIYPEISAGQVSTISANESEVLIITCDRGYKIKGPNVVYCISGEWTTPGKCIWSHVACSKVTLKNGRYLGHTTNHGDLMILVCDEGYELQGANVIYCNFGEWTMPGECTRKKEDCSELTLKNGKLIGDSTYLGSYMTIVCDEGYELHGANIVYCYQGNWTAPGECVPVNSCSRPSIKISDDRIYGGERATMCEFPWMVALKIHPLIPPKPPMLPPPLDCAGFIIGDRWILTAAHCTKHMNSGHRFNVTIGLTNLKNAHTDNQVEMEHIFIHPDYDNFPLGNDFALIKLGHRLFFSHTVSKICLPDESMCNETTDSTADNVDSCSSLLTAGWGRTKKGAYSYNLMKVGMKVISIKECETAADRIGIRNFKLRHSQFCAVGSTDEKGTCTGDSGGPLVCRKRGAYYAVGVTSFLFKGQCTQPGSPSVYARICGVLPWIRGTMEYN